MGNYCAQYDSSQHESVKLVRKISNCSNSTTVSKFNSVDSMRKHSSEVLNFLQNQNLNIINSNEKIEDIQVLAQLGKGGQSKVFQIMIKGVVDVNDTSIESEKMIALKRTNLKKQKQNQNSLELSRKLLVDNQSPFLIKSLFSFSCQKYLYSAMTVAQGGDLTSFLQKWRGKGDAFRKLGEEGVRLVLAGIILGLQYIHNKNFIYCDLKTDNVLIDKNGYPVLTDFQLISDKSKIPVQDFRGTITYIGPQIYFNQFVDKGIDLWAFRILSYFITYNSIPFIPKEIQSTKFVEQCANRQGKYGKQSSKTISKSLFDFINSLLKAKPEQRLGYQNTSELKNHKFFNGFDWQKYSEKQMQSPLADIVQEFPIKSRLLKSKSKTNSSSTDYVKQKQQHRKLRKYTA